VPCPTCSATMHGVGHGHARAIVEKMLETERKAVGLSYEARENGKAVLENVLEALADANARDFWCPNCGTVRTVTGEHNADQPPRLVERVKAADDAGTTLSRPGGGTTSNDGRLIPPNRWADVRRCIGRDRPCTSKPSPTNIAWSSPPSSSTGD